MKKWKFALFAILFLFFTNYSTALAHEGEEQESESDNYLKDFSTNEHDHSDTEEEVTDSHDSHKIEGSTHESEGSSSHDSHETDATSDHGSQNHSETTIDEGDHDDSSSHNEEGAHGTFTGEETGPNYIVLSSFVSVNAGFLLIGIWNKVRKRGNKHGLNK